MLNIKLDEEANIAILEPEGKLSEADFRAVADIIDPYIEKTGKLNGIIIYVKSFPGWYSFSALLNHMKFIRDHHRKVAHVAFVTDSPIGSLAEHVGSHFVNAKVRHFDFDELDEAINWASTENNT